MHWLRDKRLLDKVEGEHNLRSYLATLLFVAWVFGLLVGATGPPIVEVICKIITTTKQQVSRAQVAPIITHNRLHFIKVCPEDIIEKTNSSADLLLWWAFTSAGNSNVDISLSFLRSRLMLNNSEKYQYYFCGRGLSETRFCPLLKRLLFISKTPGLLIHKKCSGISGWKKKLDFFVAVSSKPF